MNEQWRTEFATFYAESGDDCLRAVCASIPNADSAEDLVAEAFARAYQHWSAVRVHPAPTAWVLRTALNLHRDEWRRRSRPRRALSIVQHEPDTERLDPSLVDALDHLSDRQREVLVLRVLLGLSTRQTADEIGIEPSTVPVHLRRALAGLRTSPTIQEYLHEHA